MAASQIDKPSGPLVGLKVLEFAGIGPAPFCGMLLADMGADVVRIDRPGTTYDRYKVEARGRRSIALDLKTDAGRETALRLATRAEALIEGFRPGVMERLGLGPEAVHARIPKLVYGRMTGWGQTGPLASAPGHDIDYIALSGALHAIGPKSKPAIPINLVGDFGGGALYLAMGVLAAVMHARATGEGQVIDCAMTDGAISLMGMFYGHRARGTWTDKREANIIDGGSHFYNVYQCKDGAWLALGAIEPQFYKALVELAGLDDPAFEHQGDVKGWPGLKKKLAAVIKTRTRAEWMALLEGSDACAAPVLSLDEAPSHPHNAARGSFVEVDGVTQPAPAPRFSKTPGAVQRGPEAAAAAGELALKDWGVTRA
jgi:alpha-methylacyl-CoA racemase